MISNCTYSIFLIFIVQLVFSQNEKLLNGKIVVKNSSPQGVHVINLVNEQETITNIKGEFKILAKPDDLLVFSSLNLDYQRKIVEVDDYNAPLLIIEMTSKINQLDEVIVTNYSKINAVDLGILLKPAKEYTPAERRLKTATGFISIDPILNLISGRTAMLKKELEVEKKEILLAQIIDMYEDSFYIDNLKINKNLIKGFQYYIIEMDKFVSALHSKNKNLISFSIIELAVEFNKINTDEK